MSMALVVYLQITAVYILLSWALYLPFRAGQFFNGPVYCMAVGAYTAAMLAKTFGLPFPVVLLAGMLAAMIFALIPAPKLAHVGGFAMTIATIAIIFIVYAVLRNVKALGGLTGFFGIPKVDYLLPVSWLIVFLVGIFVYRLEHSRLGRAMEAIFTDKNLACAMGVNPVKMSIFLQVASGGISGLAGVLFAFTMGIIRPVDFGFGVLLYTWTMMFVGGYQTMWGVVVAAPLLWALTQFLPSQVAEYTNIIFGIILAAMLLLRPEGLITKRLLQRLANGGRSLKANRA